MNETMKATFRQIADMNPLILDTETTGLGMNDEVLSVAVADKDGKLLFSSLVKPAKRQAWQKAQVIHGISPKMVAKAPSFEAIVPQLTEVLNGRCLIGWNIGFDRNMLFNSSRHFFDLQPFRNLLFELDTRDLMEIYAKCWGYRWEKLSVVCARHSIATINRAHTAVGDCQLVAELLKVLCSDVVPVRPIRETRRGGR